MTGRCNLTSATLHGVEAQLVRVEISIAGGVPGMYIVGMPDTAVQEARERVRGAIRASGYTMPNDNNTFLTPKGDYKNLIVFQKRSQGVTADTLTNKEMIQNDILAIVTYHA